MLKVKVEFVFEDDVILGSEITDEEIIRITREAYETLENTKIKSIEILER